VKGKINELEANSNSESIRNLHATYIQECKKVTNWIGKCKSLTYSFITGLNAPSFAFIVEV